MNMVRIVALGVGAVGVAVVAASQFQGAQIGDAAQAQLTPAVPSGVMIQQQATALVSTPATSDSARPTLVAAATMAMPSDSAAGQGSVAEPIIAQGATGATAPSVPLMTDTTSAAATPVAPGLNTSIPAVSSPATAGAPMTDVATTSLAAATDPVPPLGHATVLMPPETPAIATVPQDALRSPEVLEHLAHGHEYNLHLEDGAIIAGATEPLDADLEAELNACAVWLVVTAAPSAMLDVSVYAPCDHDSSVELTHAGLTFDARIGHDNQLVRQIPALSEEGAVTLRMPDGREQTDVVLVPDLAGIDRIALQWTAPAALSLHAYEFGAHFGDAGHIHAGNPQGPGNPSRGFMTVLGDPLQPGARMAQVYSYPTGQSPENGQVTLEIEVPVTDATCGKVVSAHALELNGVRGSGQVRTLNVEMPECDGTGGFVVLPGVLPGLQIALN